jgi:tetratricopeptide (TPR) repeat protein
MASGTSAVAWIALVVAGAGVGLALRAGSRAPAPAEADGEADLLDAKSLENRINNAEGRLEAAERKVRELEERVAKAEKATEEAGVLARQARTLVEETVRAEAAAPRTGEAAGATEDAKKAEADALLAAIREGKIPDHGLFAHFQKAKELGVLDQALAEMERYAAAHAGDPDAQVDLAGAYIAKLMSVPEGMERGQWATKSLASCEAALKIDPEHWDGQFMKGMNLSQWPAFLGKQPEAIRTFEKLIEQQERSAPDPRYAQTYFQLGTVYRAAGNVEKARAAFARGLELYPADKQLREQVDVIDKK